MDLCWRVVVHYTIHIGSWTGALPVWEVSGLDVPSDADPVDDAVVPGPEIHPGPWEVQVLGGESQQVGIGVDDIVPLDGLAREGAGASVYALCDPDEVIARAVPVRIQCQM